MKKLVLIIFDFIILLSGCTTKPMTEEKMIVTIHNVFSDYKRQKAVVVLKENEAIIGTSEFMAVSGIHDSNTVRNIDYIISFRALDRSYYYALYSSHYGNSVGAVLMRVRKGDMLSGVVIWNRENEDAVMSIVNYNDTMCYISIEHRNGTLEFDQSFRLEREIDGEWEEYAVVNNDAPVLIKRVETSTKRLYWEAECGSLYPGTYRIIVPVTCNLFDENHKAYDEEMELSSEFIIEP